jgi:ArsR family metal-binding transcriptional regulator
MLLQSFEPEIVLPPCDFGRETVNALAHLGADISPVFPYLNATQAGAIYYAAAPTLRFRFEGHMVTLQPRQIAVGGLADGDEAVLVLARLQRLINDTWDRRGEIGPSSVERKRLSPLAVYKLLPGTNCRICGQPTCLVFANKLVVSQADLARCTPLCQEEPYRGQWAELQAMLDLAP